MKNFARSDLSFSLCGLNCALCTMKLGGHCPGCGGGEGNQGCAIARCSLERGGYDYCFECGSYPCKKYDGITEFDSFITHRNQLRDMQAAKERGLEDYLAGLNEKAAALGYLLENCNDGRRKTFFSLAVNLLELSDVWAVMQRLQAGLSIQAPLKERAAAAVKYLEDAAKQRGVPLRLNRKPPGGRGEK